MTSTSDSLSSLGTSEETESIPSSRSRGRSRGRGRGRGRSRGRGRAASSGRRTPIQEENHLLELRRLRRERVEAEVRDMPVEELRQYAIAMVERHPGSMFDLMDFHRARQGPPPTVNQEQPWCSCGNCQEMPTDEENICCREEPSYCLCNLQHFQLYCLDEGNLRIHRDYREELTYLGQTVQPGDDNREYRYAAYRHFTFWQHGSLGAGQRRVIPSCCVVKIRQKFPDPHGRYTGYKPGI